MLSWAVFWAAVIIASVAGGTIGVIVMACCCAARDADRRNEFWKLLDDVKVRVRWTCPECGFEQADYVPVARPGLRIEYLAETEVTCSGFIGGCGKQFVIGPHVIPQIKVEEWRCSSIRPEQPTSRPTVPPPPPPRRG